MTMIFEHVAITVNDLDKSIDFYTTIFDYKLARKTDTNAYLYLDTDLLEIMQSISPKKIEKPNNPDDWWKKAHGPIGLSHIGFRVDNLDKTIKKLKAYGCELVKPPYLFKPNMKFRRNFKDEKLKKIVTIPEKGWKIAYFSDPDGIIIEILER